MDGDDYSTDPGIPLIRSKTKALVTRTYRKSEAGDLGLIEGQYVYIIKKNEYGYWKGEAPNGEVGWFPETYVKEIEASSTENQSSVENSNPAAAVPAPMAMQPPPPPVYTEKAVARASPNFVVAIDSFDANSPDKLSFNKGERLRIVSYPEEDPDLFEARNCYGNIGFVPRKCFEMESTSSSSRSTTPTTNWEDTQLQDTAKEEFCVVCGEKSNGDYNGVKTCESCKSFFRRHQSRPILEKCKYSGMCDMRKSLPQYCPKCRLRKCFRMGMNINIDNQQAPKVVKVIGGTDQQASSHGNSASRQREAIEADDSTDPRVLQKKETILTKVEEEIIKLNRARRDLLPDLLKERHGMLIYTACQTLIANRHDGRVTREEVNQWLWRLKTTYKKTDQIMKEFDNIREEWMRPLEEEFYIKLETVSHIIGRIIDGCPGLLYFPHEKFQTARKELLARISEKLSLSGYVIDPFSKSRLYHLLGFIHEKPAVFQDSPEQQESHSTNVGIDEIDQDTDEIDGLFENCLEFKFPRMYVKCENTTHNVAGFQIDDNFEFIKIRWALSSRNHVEPVIPRPSTSARRPTVLGVLRAAVSLEANDHFCLGQIQNEDFWFCDEANSTKTHQAWQLSVYRLDRESSDMIKAHLRNLEEVTIDRTQQESHSSNVEFMDQYADEVDEDTDDIEGLVESGLEIHTIRPKTKAFVNSTYEPEHPGDIGLTKGQYVYVVKKKTDGWWKGEAANGDVGWFPARCVKEVKASTTGNQESIESRIPAAAVPAPMAVQPPPPPAQTETEVARASLDVVVATKSFDAKSPDELSFNKGERLKIVSFPEGDSDWCQAINSHGNIGFVPREFIKNDIRDKMEFWRNRATKLSNENQTLNKRLTDFEEAAPDIDALNSNNLVLKQEISSLTQKNNSISNNYKLIRIENRDLKEKIEKLEDEINTTLNIHKEANEKLNTENVNVQNENKALHEEKKKLEEEKSDMGDELSSLRAKVMQMEGIDRNLPEERHGSFNESDRAEERHDSRGRSDRSDDRHGSRRSRDRSKDRHGSRRSRDRSEDRNDSRRSRDRSEDRNGSRRNRDRSEDRNGSRRNRDRSEDRNGSRRNRDRSEDRNGSRRNRDRSEDRNGSRRNRDRSEDRNGSRRNRDRSEDRNGSRRSRDRSEEVARYTTDRNGKFNRYRNYESDEMKKLKENNRQMEKELRNLNDKLEAKDEREKVLEKKWDMERAEMEGKFKTAIEQQGDKFVHGLRNAEWGVIRMENERLKPLEERIPMAVDFVETLKKEFVEVTEAKMMLAANKEELEKKNQKTEESLAKKEEAWEKEKKVLQAAVAESLGTSNQGAGNKRRWSSGGPNEQQPEDSEQDQQAKKKRQNYRK